jgi:hypothetical protein
MMKTIQNISKAIAANFLPVCLVMLFWAQQANAEQIDAGIFSSESQSNVVEVKIKPDFTINADETISGIVYTIRWTDPSVEITSIGYIFPLPCIGTGCSHLL